MVAAWPVAVEEIALVGHSMGGLVARSACHQAAEAGMALAGRVRHVVSLGTPHHGAPLKHGVHLAAHALHALPETRPFARFLRRRSAGIRDLRHGSLVDRDWEGCDPDALRAAACAEVPLLPARRTASSRRRSRATRATPSAGSSATGSSSRRALPAAAGRPRSPSARRTG